MPAIKDIASVAKKYNGELCGGRVIVVIDGVRQYITDTGPEGNWFNLVGQQLEQGDIAVDTPAPAEEEAEVVTRTRKPRAEKAAVTGEPGKTAPTPAPAPAPAPASSLDDEVASALAGE